MLRKYGSTSNLIIYEFCNLQNYFTQFQNNQISWFNFQYFSDTNIQPIPLSDGSDPEIGEIVKAVGWGKDSDDADWIR